MLVRIHLSKKLLLIIMPNKAVKDLIVDSSVNFVINHVLLKIVAKAFIFIVGSTRRSGSKHGDGYVLNWDQNLMMFVCVSYQKQLRTYKVDQASLSPTCLLAYFTHTGRQEISGEKAW